MIECTLNITSSYVIVTLTNTTECCSDEASGSVGTYFLEIGTTGTQFGNEGFRCIGLHQSGQCVCHGIIVQRVGEAALENIVEVGPP